MTYLVVFVERGQRKVLVNYAKRQVGNRVMQGQSTHLPLKLNMAGDSAHFRIQHHFVSRDGGGWFGNTEGAGLAEIDQQLPASGTAGVCAAVRSGNRFLLLFLHRSGVSEGNRRQPEKERRLHSGHSSG